MTALESRSVAGMTSDPDNNVLIDMLMSAGLVRHIDVWTDEEAERCRLAAFVPQTGEGVRTRNNHWRHGRSRVFRLGKQSGNHCWVWNFAVAGRGMECTNERPASAFDLTDFSLGVFVSKALERHMRAGVPMPECFRRKVRR